MKYDSLILALRRLLPCTDIEIISDNDPTVSIGDIIHLRKFDDVISGAYARWQEDDDIDITNEGQHSDESDEGEEAFAEHDDEDTLEARIKQKIKSSISDNAYSSCKFATDAFAIKWAAVQNHPHIAIVTDIDRSTKRIEIMYARLATSIRKNYPLDIVLTDKAAGQGGFNDAAQKYLSQYSFQSGNKTFLLVGHHLFGHNSSFVLLDGQSSLSITEEYRSECGGAPDAHGTEKVWAAKNGSKLYHSDAAYRIEVWQSTLKFSDASSATILADSARAILKEGNEEYISLWKRYAEIDFKYVSDCQEKAGVLRFTKLLDNTPERAILRIDNYTQIAAFKNTLNEVDKESQLVDIFESEQARKSVHASIVEFKDREVIVDLASNGPLNTGKGFIKINIHSAEVQHNRRMEAIDMILSMHSAKEGLLSLLNGNMPQLPDEKRRITPLSQSIIKKVFPDHDPTPNQIEAIRIALNTPDFAIIQGPPGTGKTTVIRAIYEALAEKEKDPQLFFGRNLATAYQRDATVHLAEEMDVYGLPARTFLGRRDGGWEESDRSVRLWLEKTRQKVYEANPMLEGYAILDKLSNDLDLLRLSFDLETAIDEKREAAIQSFLYELECFEIKRNELDPQNYDEFQVESTCESIDLEPFKQRANEMLSAMQDTHSHEHDVDLCYAVMLPTTPEAMEDNGRQMIHNAFLRLTDERQRKDVQDNMRSLEQLYNKQPIRYERVRNGINALLAKLRGRSGLAVNQKANSAFIELIQNTIETIQAVVGNDEMYILSHYVNAFEDSSAMTESLSRFLTVIAATNQMVASSEVVGRKSPNTLTANKKRKSTTGAVVPVSTASSVAVTGKKQDVYENVVIDEAARSCPPDLLIPLCRAKERMILVGDQKQLPQFISDNVYKQMAAEKSDTVLLKKSMFEYLIDQVAKLAASGDGKQRYIMLDQQFRMPAIIGNIVSNHFYDGKLQSPLGNGGKKLPIGLSFSMRNGAKNDRIGRSHLVWLNVAGRSGTRESRDSTGSAYRDEEVDRIAGMMKTLIASAEGQAKDYRYGIITFYKRQEIKLKEKIRKILLENESPVCSKEWYDFHVEIGTVDAFQGKEFDIVFLSMVRCHTDYGSFRYGGIEEKGRAKYGFTMDENRLCVALSRVKKCLIVVGDEHMFNDEDAKKIMPAIYDLLNICKTADERGESYAWYIEDTSGKKNA